MADEKRREQWRRAARVQLAKETPAKREARLRGNRDRARARRIADREGVNREMARYMRGWRARNPEKRRAAHAEYRERNRAVFRRYWSERKQRRRTCQDRDAHRSYAEVVAGDPCAYCGGVTEQIDHIVPLARGGEDEWTNLAGACTSCNSRKWATPLLLFLIGDARA